MVAWCRRKSPKPVLTEQQLADRRHKRGWLAYAFASEAFVVVTLTLFLPVALEQYARDNGRATPDLVTPCEASTVPSDAGCKVTLAGISTETTSFSLYVNAASVGLQTLLVISLGTIADRLYYRKQLLLGFAWLGAFCTVLFFAVSSSSPAWPVIIVFAILASVGYGVSSVPLNAYLPGIAARDPSVLALRSDAASISSLPDGTLVPADINAPVTVSDEEKAAEKGVATASVSDAVVTDAMYVKALSHAMARISAQGVVSGLIAGITLLIISIIPVVLLGGSTLSLRIAMGMSGLWWGAFTFPTMRWLSAGGARGPRPSVAREAVRAWAELGAMLRPREIARMRNTFQFLLAWFLLSDGLTTITATAILFAKTTLHMTSVSLIALAVLTPASGIVSVLLLPPLSRRFGISNRNMIVIVVSLAALLPAYGCLGLLPAVANKKPPGGGLTSPIEMYPAAVYFGLMYGAFQSYARALVGEMIPPGEEARWFALFSITDKSSSFVGPLIVGLIADTTGNIRWAFLFLLGMVLVAIPIVATVDVRRGRADAVAYSRERGTAPEGTVL